ncbi:MAG: hypothetical protein Q4F61_00155 [Candidatus Saccharibacteria bacterium]|nr:hypothetical protein [Candidatus Saccharibacteria bacterium]
MVCIAAFIILAIIGVFVAVISIFKPKVGKAYLKMFKKAWGCLWKKVRLQKCETGFKDDVKNTLLSRVIIKHPKWVKPLSVIVEILSVVIVVVAVWAVLTAIKSLLALWALGTCNVTKPEACSLGAEVCSIDNSEPDNFFEATGRWFTEWGEIFEAIPDKFRSYNAEDYDLNYISANPGSGANKPIAVDIFDPGCSACMASYKNQKEAGFFDKYDVHLVPFAIQDSEGNYKFKNSEIIVKYIFAVEQLRSGFAVNILDRIFTERNEDGVSYQNIFNEDYDEKEAREKLEEWIVLDGFSRKGLEEIRKIVDYPETADKMKKNKEIVENSLHIKGIPTFIYDGKKHTGLFKL